MPKLKISKLDRIAIKISNIVGTMPFFFACCILVFIPFILPHTLTMVQFISSGFLQLVLLPLMVINQNIASKLSDMETRGNFNKDLKINKKELSDSEKIIKLLNKLNKKL